MIATGGTGGHVYPALAVAEAQIAQQPNTELAFVGTNDGFERPLIEKSNVPFHSYDEVSAAPLNGVPLLKALLNVLKLLWGVVQSLGVLRRRQPDVILTTGGWVSFPVCFGAWLLRIPVVIFLPDIEPGMTIQQLQRFATVVTLTTPESIPFFPKHKRLVVTGYPLRRQLMDATRATALEHFKLDATKQTLLVFGGSRGAQSLNIALIDALPRLLARGDVQILHLTGTLDWERTAPYRATPHYHPFAYLHEDMGLAYAVADLVVCRAGASTLGEMPFFGLPAILVPYPHVWRYQKVNADYLEKHGCALYMADETLGDALLPTLNTLFDTPERLAQMSQKAREIAHDDSAGAIATVLQDLVQQRKGQA